MKQKSVNRAIAAEPTEFNTAIATVQSAVNTSEPVSDKDKKGGKVSDKELSLMSFAIDNLPKIERKLPRDFDENGFIVEYDEMNTLLTKRDELQAIVNHINAQVTAKRVTLKVGYSIIYAAAQEAATENSALKYISEKLGEIYLHANSNTDATKTKVPDVTNN